MKERDTNSDMVKHRIHQTNGQHYDDNNLSTSFANTPMKRLGHAAAILGNCLVVHGGINGEENKSIQDTDNETQEYACFDF